MEIKIERINDSGEGIGISKGKVFFVPKTIPGDIVLVKDIKDYRKYATASIDKIIISSNNRIEARCPYFYNCGGCQLMNLDYSKQLLYKKNKVINMFKKYVNLDIDPEIVGSNQFNYRNKIILRVKDGKLGLYKYHSNDVIFIDKCYLVLPVINKVISIINDDIDLSFVKEVMIRSSSDNKVMVYFDGDVSDVSALKEEVSLIFVRDKLVYGSDKLITKLGNYLFEISKDSFFQVNYEQMIRLYDKVLGYIDDNSSVLDLYCGTGSIGIYVSSKCSRVFGVEINKSAIIDANRNKEINKVNNIDFRCGDVENIIKENNSYDYIIVDPPRSGLSVKTREILLKIDCKKIIYVSCNPMTLVRDIKDLKERYIFKEITLFDMFPNTYHVECVCLLCRIN